MNIQDFIIDLEGSLEFQEYKKKYPKSYLCSAFFIIDLEGTENKYHLDFYAPEDESMVSFQMEDTVKQIPVERINNDIPKKLIAKSELNFYDIEQLIKKEMEKQKIKNKLQKIIIVLQNYEENDFFICTGFLSGLGLLKIHIDSKQKKIILFEKKSFFDMFKKI